MTKEEKVQKVENGQFAQVKFLPISDISEDGVVSILGKNIRIMESTGFSFELSDRSKKLVIISSLMQTLYRVPANLSFTVYHSLYPIEEFVSELKGLEKGNGAEYIKEYKKAILRNIKEKNIGFYRYFISFEQTKDTKNLEEDLANGFRQVGMNLTRLDRNGVVNVFSSILHKHRTYLNVDDYLVDVSDRDSEAIRGMIGVGSYAVGEEEIRLGSNFAKSGFVSLYPSKLAAGYLTDVLCQPFDFLLTMHTKRVSDNEIYKEIDSKRLQIQSYMLEEQQGKKMPSLKIEQANRSLENFSVTMVSDNVASYKITTYFTVFNGSKELTKHSFEDMQSAFKNILTYPADFRERESFLSSLPLGMDFLNSKKEQLITIRGLASSIPFLVREVQDKMGVVYGISEKTRSLLKINEWNLANAHIVILGVSGMGKSFFMKSLLTRSYLMRDERIFLLDPNGEYRLMTDYLEGIYISRQRGGFSVNPFDLYYSEELPVSKAIDSAAARIKALINMMVIEPLNSTEVAMLEMAIFKTYEKFGWKRGSDEEGRDFPTLVDLTDTLQEMDTSDDGSGPSSSIAIRLIPYSTGTFSEYFAKKTSFDIASNFVAIDYTNIPKEIKAILTIIDFSMVMEKVKRDRIRTKLVIDEGWDILRTDAGSELVLEAVKTGRKYNLSVVFATQDVQDVANDKGGQTLLQNAVIKFITTQTESGLPVVRDVFNLSDREANILQGAGIGGGLLIVDTEKFPMRVIASDLEKKLFESNPLKMAEQEKLLKEEKDRRERERIAKETGIDFIGDENSADIESL